MFQFPSLQILIRLLRFHRRDNWAKFTIYRGYSSDSEVIQWFWKCVRSWPAVQRSRLLRFATGTTRIPVTGFGDLQGPDGTLHFTIALTAGPLESHANFNSIDLPRYTSYASLQQDLTLAVDFQLHLCQPFGPRLERVHQEVDTVKPKLPNRRHYHHRRRRSYDRY